MNIEKARRKEAQRVARKGSPVFRPIDLDFERTQEPRKLFIPDWLTRAYQNNLYTVMVNDNAMTSSGKATRVMIQKHDNTPFINHWATIQKIKNEIFGEETVAIEYYPKQSQLIDHKNIYWIWIFPEGIIPSIFNQ